MGSFSDCGIRQLKHKLGITPGMIDKCDCSGMSKGRDAATKCRTDGVATGEAVRDILKILRVFSRGVNCYHDIA